MHISESLGTLPPAQSMAHSGKEPSSPNPFLGTEGMLPPCLEVIVLPDDGGGRQDQQRGLRGLGEP